MTVEGSFFAPDPNLDLHPELQRRADESAKQLKEAGVPVTYEQVAQTYQTLAGKSRIHDFLHIFVERDLKAKPNLPPPPSPETTSSSQSPS